LFYLLVLVIGIRGGNRQAFDSQMSNRVHSGELARGRWDTRRAGHAIDELDLSGNPLFAKYRPTANDDAINLAFDQEADRLIELRFGSLEIFVTDRLNGKTR
jgi:hypothetical protein